MTPSTGSLWNLGGILFGLLEEREQTAEALRLAEGAGDESDASKLHAELEAIEYGITQFVAQQLRDVDGLRAPLKALEQGVAINKADAVAATNRAIILQNRYDRLKDLIKQCMVALDQAGEWKPKQTRKFESARGSFTLRGNGGAQPVVVTDETLVPDEYCQVTVTMRFQMWKEICAQCGDALVATTKTGPRTPRLSTIAEALNAPCPRCDGNGVVEAWGELDDDAEYRPAENPCKECQGTGKQSVAGCHLGPRGESVVVK